MKNSSLVFDQKVPLSLKKTELWFASIITQPIDEDSRMSPISPSGEIMEEEAFDYISPSPTLRPAQRIELYSQQYWWRLYSVLQDTVPLLTRLFGYYEFNKLIAQPYLLKYPPNTWSLNVLADLLPQWVQEDYQAKDKQLVLDAANVDVALNSAFFAPIYRPLDNEKIAALGGFENVLTQEMRLQPHVFLLDFRYDFIKFRNEMMEHEPEYWVEHDFPVLPQDKRHYKILYRTMHNQLIWEDLSETAYQMLNQFSKGSTIEKVCDWLEGQDDKVLEEASSKLHLWFQEWIGKQWLYLDE